MVSPMNQIIEQSRSTINISYTNGLAAAYGFMRALVAIQGGGNADFTASTVARSSELYRRHSRQTSCIFGCNGIENLDVDVLLRDPFAAVRS
jgi:hypothetical protein